ncbi:MAG: hypothetical protein IKZ55_10075 [Bacteroidales bacterium]|nr:hypothetical protein [Bacteroidales bacterium]
MFTAYIITTILFSIAMIVLVNAIDNERKEIKQELEDIRKELERLKASK